MANGRVITGYSKPYVAIYSVSTTGVVSYSSGQVLARGVGVNISPDDASDNKFYADNIVAESASTKFTTGTATITVDGLKTAARKLILGLPAATSGWVHYGDSQSVPYVGFGCVVRYMEDGVTTYEPLVLPKIMFNQENTVAQTQEEEIDWQTTDLTAKIERDDSTNHDWRLDGDAKTTEALAEAEIKTLFSIS